MLKLMKVFKKDRRGFTLVELMAVVVILGILAAFAIPKVIGSVTSAKDKTDKANIETLQRAVERVYLETGKYPSQNLQELFPDYVEKMPKVPTDDSKTYILGSDKKVTHN